MSQLDDVTNQLVADVAAENAEIDSLETLATGLQKMLADAIAASAANGVTPAQLKPLTDLAATIESKTSQIHTAVLANTPSASQAPEPVATVATPDAAAAAVPPVA